MAIKDIIAPGIGFTPGGVNYIVTRGFDNGPAAALAQPVAGGLWRMGLNRLGPGISFIVGALWKRTWQMRPRWSFAK